MLMLSHVLRMSRTLFMCYVLSVEKLLYKSIDRFGLDDSKKIQLLGSMKSSTVACTSTCTCTCILPYMLSGMGGWKVARNERNRTT